MKTHVLSIGYGRNLFTENDPERIRLRMCAEQVASLHMIVFSRRAHNLTVTSVSEKYTLHPTHSLFRVGMIFDAVKAGLRVMRQYPASTEWTISAQDPLAAGIAGFILKIITRRPLLIQEHGDIFSGSYWRNERLGNKVWYGVASFLIRHADRVRVVSNRVRDHVMSVGVSEEKIVSLPVYTDVAAWRESQIKVDLKALYPDASVIILSMARLVPQKNLTMLVRAFAKLHATDPRALLILVGRGEEEGTIAYEIKRQSLGNSVVCMPWTENPSSLMKTADIYALSSNYEGWGRVLIEAMLSGLPIVTTEVGCAGECIVDGVHGYIIPVQDEKAFAEALIKLSQNPGARVRFKANEKRDSEHVFPNHVLYARAWARTHEWNT
ncbi:glycosyltransferase [Patescibacteria group bacterium]|nr:glycosyltransferase [Patescibacteria group bacterium]